MIFEELLSSTKAMQELQKKVSLQKNKEMQENIDTKYRTLLTQSTYLIDTLDYLYNDFGISQKSEIIQSLMNLIDYLEKAVESGLASGEKVNLGEMEFKSIQGIMKKEWASIYMGLTADKLGILEAIQGIKPDIVNSCIIKIQKAENWDIDINNYKSLNQGLSDSDHLINELGLDDEIVAFLQLANEGKATLKNINENILCWINNEHLENKIRISFIKTK